MNTVLFLFSLLVLCVYIAYIVLRFGVLKSISESYNVLPPKDKLWFSLTMMIWPIPLMIVASTPLMFFGGAFICLVGAAPAGKFADSMETKIHVVGATSGIVLSAASMGLDFHLWIFPILLTLFTGYCLSKWSKIKNHTWWIEVMAIGFTFLTLLIKRI